MPVPLIAFPFLTLSFPVNLCFPGYYVFSAIRQIRILHLISVLQYCSTWSRGVRLWCTAMLQYRSYREKMMKKFNTGWMLLWAFLIIGVGAAVAIYLFLNQGTPIE